MQQNNIAETVIGAIVVAVAVIFLSFAYMRTGSGSLSGYELNARMPKVDGLGVGTDVRLAGIKIGSVSDLTLDPKTYLVTVHLNIRDDIKIPTDSSLLITSAGILGSSYLSITPGGDDKMLVAGGYFDNVQGSIDLMNLITRFGTGESTTNQAPPAKPQTPQQLPPGHVAVKRFLPPLLLAGACASAAHAQGVTPARQACAGRQAHRSRASRLHRRTAADPSAAPDVGATSQPLQPAGPMILLLRGLDKITGRPTDIVAPINKPVHFATLTITARYCYSTPASETPETAAFVQIDDHRPDQPEKRVFSGWMYASSPGLNAVEHPLYDVWAISCNTNAPGATPRPAIASSAPVKVAAPDSSDKEGRGALPEAGR